MNLALLKELGSKFTAAIDTVDQLVKSGAIQKDIDDAQAVVKEVAGQIGDVVSGSVPPVA